MNSNNMDDIETNDYLSDGNASKGIGLINIHNISNFNESSYFNYMHSGFEKGYVSIGNGFM